MKKLFSKMLSVVLAALMVFSCTSTAFADNGVTPVIVVHGMGAIAVYKNPTSKDKSDIASFDVGSLFTSNNDVLHTLIDATQGKVTDASFFIDQLAKLLESFKAINCDKDGNPAVDTGIADYWTDSLANHIDYLTSKETNEPAISRQIADKIGVNNVYAFNYDWRVDAAVNAENLDKYIDIVKAQTGKSKVTIIAGSEGTVVTSVYMDAHKNDNELEKVVFLDSAFNGVGIGKLFAQDVVFNKDVLLNYIAEVTKTFNNKSFDMSMLSWLSETMPATVENLCNLFNKILNDPTLCKEFYMEVLYPVLGNVPSLWEFIPYADFDIAVAKMSAMGFLDKTSGLYTKITNYHAVQSRLVSNITALKNSGVDVAIIANYGIPAIPVTSDLANQSDILIDTEYASVGATVADYGKTLPQSKTQKNQYASLDEIIDASTCAFPDNTWFFKGVGHMDYWYNSEAGKFLAQLVTTDVPMDIKSVKASTGYGQFVSTDSAQKLTNVAGTNKKVTKISKLKKKSKASAVVSWKKKSGVMGYQVQYSTSSKFTKKKTKAVTVSGAKKTSKTIKKLKKNKKYYVRVRTYKVVANQKVYSAWSSAKTVKTK